MAAGNTANSTSAASAMEVSTSPPLTAEEATAKAVQKRFEGLAMVRNKAVKGKGAWYWAHLEPLLVHHTDSSVPKAVKLKCRLCAAVFSASNPSRTAAEHLKRGTCPNFSATSLPNAASPHPISTLPPQSDSPTSNHRKRTSSAAEPSQSYNVSPLTIIDPSRYYHEVNFPHSPASVPALVSPSTAIVAADSSAYSHHPHFTLSGGKSDLGPLATFENSVKRLKSPKKTPPPPALTKSQIEFALDCLTDWVYESCGSVSFSTLNHPKFKTFLTQLGLPPLSTTHLSASKLDSKYEQAKNEAEARTRESMFFQIASDGWKQMLTDEHLVNLTVNLPNGTSVFQRAVFIGSSQVLPSKYAEEVLLDSIGEICVSSMQQCVGIVGDRFKNKALRNLETQHPWMVNLSCQIQGFLSLIKDLYKELPLFRNVANSCLKLADFVNNKTQVRICFRKYQMQEYGCSVLLRVAGSDKMMNFDPVFSMVEDIMSSGRALQSLVLDESYKMVSIEDPVAREIGQMIMDVGFWNDLEAVRSIVFSIKEMTHEIETERPVIGQCLPLWEELRAKLKDLCVKFRISDSVMEKIFERRFKKNYHPAWSAAYILDPLYLIRDASGNYLPPFKHLTPEQEKDVDKLITRLVPKEEAHIALMELMKWRSEGLDPVYARAVQVKQRDPKTGKLKIANPQSSRLVWETYLTEFKSLRKIAVRLIFLHATSRRFKCNSSFLRRVNALGRNRAGFDKAQKMIFIAANLKLKRRDLSSEDDKDAELFANGEEDVLNEVFVDA